MNITQVNRIVWDIRISMMCIGLMNDLPDRVAFNMKLSDYWEGQAVKEINTTVDHFTTSLLKLDLYNFLLYDTLSDYWEAHAGF